jgi:hypothetical protein
MERPGNPARHDGIVRRIAGVHRECGSAARSPIAECHVGEVGVTIASKAVECLADAPG